MTEAPSSQLAAFFDRRSKDSGILSFSASQVGRLRLFEALWGIEPGERVLEAGCGTGRLTERLAAAVGSRGRVRACDLSTEMLGVANARGLPLQAAVVRESVCALGAGDETFDQVVCLNSFHFFPIKAAVGELSRVLRPGGKLWINHFEGTEELNRHFRRKGSGFEDYRLPLPDDLRHLLESACLRVERFVDGADGCWLEAAKAYPC